MSIELELIENDVTIPAEIENTDTALSMEIDSDAKSLDLAIEEENGEMDISLNELSEDINLEHEKVVVIEAEAGGYYTPQAEQIDDDTVRISFTPRMPSRGDAAEGAIYTPGENISIENNIISVLTTDDVEEDNTKPITSAGVHVQIGNIQVLLDTI